MAQVNWTAEATLFNVMQVNQLPVTAKEISLATSHDPTLAKVMHFTINGWPDKKELDLQLQPYVTRQNELSLEEGCLLWGARTIIPPKFRSQLLQDLHNDHPGMVRMKALARLHVWWPNLNQEIERTVRECKICQETQPKAPQAEANPWRWPTLPWSRVHVDFAGPMSGEMFFILIDAHSKWPEVYRMESTNTESTIEVLRHIFAEQGVPREVVSDNGPQFIAESFQKFMKANNVKHIRSPPYHPSTNGEAERFVRVFKTAMRAKKGLNLSWNQKICDFLLTYRTTPHSTTHRTPAELNGRPLRTRLDAVHPNIGQRIQRQTTPSKPTRQVEVGEPVLARDYRNRKETWVAGIVLKKLSPCTYRIQVGKLMWKRHIDQLRHCSESMILEESGTDQADDIQVAHPVMGLPIPAPIVTTVSEKNTNRDCDRETVSTYSEARRPPSPGRDMSLITESPIRAREGRPETGPMPRRSQRHRSAPTYLKDYVQDTQTDNTQ